MTDFHTHSHPHHHHASPGGAGEGLVAALLLTLVFAVIEAFTGWWAQSLALISDAGHMLTDSLSLGLAALAAHFARRPPSARHSYGLVRLEVLAALINGLFMLGIVVFIVTEAVDRFSHPRQVAGGAVLGVAVVGLLINLGVAWQLTRGEHTLNKRGALLHVMGDALGSVAAIAAGTVILLTGWMPIDPILSLVVSLLILVSTLNLLRETLHVLMEGVPRHLDLNRVGQALAALDNVARVHDLHIWTLASGQIAISAHLNIQNLDQWPHVLDEARKLLAHDFGIGHVTLQPEVLESEPVTFHPPHD
jgi:cobalt-zinc-cadmium efflux system protein